MFLLQGSFSIRLSLYTNSIIHPILHFFAEKPHVITDVVAQTKVSVLLDRLCNNFHFFNILLLA